VPAVRFVTEVDTRHDIRRTECDLLGFRKEIVTAAIEYQTSDFLNRELFFRNNLRSVENVKRKLVGEVLVRQLKTRFPFGKAT